jgi:dihydropteroate synthase
LADSSPEAQNDIFSLHTFLLLNPKVTPFSRTLNLRGKIFDLSQPAVMGILNLTPDSFFAGSRVQAMADIESRCRKMLEAGAGFIDLGGYSTRPGAAEVSEAEEISRVIPALERLMQVFPEANFSIDTFRSSVAKLAVEAGAVLVNDVSGGQADEKMFDTVSRLGVPYVLMHSRGNPQTMTSLNRYENLILEIIQFFQARITILRELGQTDIVLDVGFGFAKNIEQNYQLLANLSAFDLFGLPVLAGLSRKSLIYKKLKVTPEEALNGTTVLNTIALMNGISILRVHDVKEAVEAVKLVGSYEI